jgi:hypothetical protein
MNSLPPQHRGAGGGMNQTFQNSAQVLSIGVFFTLMIIGLASNLPHTLSSGLQAHGVSAAAASSAAHTPPVSVLFAAFLGYNPIEHLVGTHVLGSLSAANRTALAGRSFFPHLISGPFRTGLHEAFLFAILACLIAAGASLLRGGKFHYVEPGAANADAERPAAGAAGANGTSRAAGANGSEAPNGADGAGSLDNGAGELARTTTAEEQHAR